MSFYIAVKCIDDCLDQVGRDYYQKLILQEHLKRLHYDLTVDRISKSDKAKPTYHDVAVKEPMFQGYTNKDFDNLNRIANQFIEIKGIIKYFLTSASKTTTDKQFYDTLPILLNAYNIVSSYVHGGAIAESETFSSQLQGTKQGRMLLYIKFAKLLNAAVKEKLIVGLVPTHNDYYNAMLVVENYFRMHYGITR